MGPVSRSVLLDRQAQVRASRAVVQNIATQRRDDRLLAGPHDVRVDLPARDPAEIGVLGVQAYLRIRRDDGTETRAMPDDVRVGCVAGDEERLQNRQAVKL